MREPKIYLKIILNYMVAIAITCVLIFLVPKAIKFFFPFLIGWILAMIANPLVQFMERRIKIVRKHSSAIIIVAVLALVCSGLYFGIAAIVKQGVSLLQELPELYTELESQIEDITTRFENIRNIMPESIRTFANDLMDNTGEYISRMISKMEVPSFSDAGILVKNVAEFLFMSIITVLCAYFFIAERDNMALKIRKHVPSVIMKQWDMIMSNVKRAVGGYFKAQFKIMIVIGLILFVGFAVLGIKYAFLLALFTAFLDLLPIFGTGAVIWPMAIFSLATGDYLQVIGLLIIYLICQVVKQILQPKMVGDSIGISAFQTLLFMFIGYRLGGLLGLIIGIPIGMVLVSFYHAGMFDQLIEGYKIIVHDLGEFMKF